MNLILWIYIVLLLAGGAIGFFKAGSKASLISSAIFAAILALVASGLVTVPYLAEGVIGFLLLFFGMRFFRGRKFMPAGFMAALSLIALVLLFAVR